jgi:hypothetical protein
MTGNFDVYVICGESFGLRDMICNQYSLFEYIVEHGLAFIRLPRFVFSN